MAAVVERSRHNVEIVAVIVGFWLVLVSIYLGLMFVAAHRRVQQKKDQTATIRSGAFSARTGTSREQPVLGGLFSEVDLLRVQVETLRSEMSALNGSPRAEKARLRRYRSGQYTDLPRTLRRQVREVRSFRHPISV